MIFPDREYAATPESVAALHSAGLSNRAIAREIRHHTVFVAVTLRSLGLKSNRRVPKSIEMVGENTARCSKCGFVGSIDDWPKSKGLKRTYYYSFCRSCAQDQRVNAWNASFRAQIKYKFQRMKCQARRRGIQFDISEDLLISLWGKQGGLCFYTDIPMKIELGAGNSPNSLSVDRVDTSCGHSPQNVVLASSRINALKGDAALEEMKSWMPEWHRRATEFLTQFRGIK